MRLLDWPPIWTCAAVVLTLLLAQGLAWPVLGQAGRLLGGGLILAGLAAMAAAVWEMQRARTTVIPRRDPTTLVTSGIFQFSRNPIYLGDALVLAGVILWADVPWALPLVGVLCAVLQARFIRDEEARLTMAFGPEFDLWAARVRRWIGRR